MSTSDYELLLKLFEEIKNEIRDIKKIISEISSNYIGHEKDIEQAKRDNDILWKEFRICQENCIKSREKQEIENDKKLNEKLATQMMKMRLTLYGAFSAVLLKFLYDWIASKI